MCERIDDGLVKACGLIGEFVIAICSHDELRSLYAERNLIKGVIGVLRKLSQPDRCLGIVKFDRSWKTGLPLLPV